jgi:hypothetical protein
MLVSTIYPRNRNDLGVLYLQHSPFAAIAFPSSFQLFAGLLVAEHEDVGPRQNFRPYRLLMIILDL